MRIARENPVDAVAAVVAVLCSAVLHAELLWFIERFMSMGSFEANVAAAVPGLALIGFAVMAREALDQDRPATVYIVAMCLLAASLGGFVALLGRGTEVPAAAALMFIVQGPVSTATMWYIVLVERVRKPAVELRQRSRNERLVRAYALSNERAARARADAAKRPSWLADRRAWMAENRSDRAFFRMHYNVPEHERNELLAAWIESYRAVDRFQDAVRESIAAEGRQVMLVEAAPRSAGPSTDAGGGPES